MGEVENRSRIPPGSRRCLTDLMGGRWQLGGTIGTGGFGEIFQVSSVDKSWVPGSYVAKIEKHSNGPLFVEVNCYLRIAKSDAIESWREQHGLPFLGMPHYVASGSHNYGNEKYRFLVLPRYSTDLEKVLKENRIISMPNVLKIAIQILNVLEYIHSKGYVHNDIKASNIMLDKSPVPNGRVLRERRPIRNRTVYQGKLRPVGKVSYVDDIPSLLKVLDECNTVSLDDSSYKRVYLLDFGLASKYVEPNGKHKRFCQDERRAHAGTILFCSRDAHKGMFSRRSDLECLGFNIVYWLTGRLPWDDLSEVPEQIAERKEKCFKQLNSFLRFSFQNVKFPKFMFMFFQYIDKLQFEEYPNYRYLRNIFEKALQDCSDDDSCTLNFDDGNHYQMKTAQYKDFRKNCKKPVEDYSILSPDLPLKPLDSNITFKRPKLRKKIKNVPIQDSIMNWSRILNDPEVILKQAKERKISEESDTCDLSNLDLEGLNPTYAMVEIYNRVMGKRNNRNKSNGLTPIKGYTPAMMNIHTRKSINKGLQRKCRQTAWKTEKVSISRLFRKNKSPARHGLLTFLQRNRRA